MSQYIDGFVLPVPTKNLPAYRQLAEFASKIYREHGALEVRECFAEDSSAPFGLSFPKGINSQPDETVVFSYIVYESRAQRDAVSAKVMADPRMLESCGAEGQEMPFDLSRMIYGGFESVVSA